MRNIGFRNALLFIINQGEKILPFLLWEEYFCVQLFWFSEGVGCLVGFRKSVLKSGCYQFVFCVRLVYLSTDASRLWSSRPLLVAGEKIFSLKCPSLWLPEIRPHISNIREGKLRTKMESRWRSQHPTVHNSLNFLFVCVIGRICGLLISLSSASPTLTHLPSSLLICLLSVILIYLPGEVQIESSQRRSQTWPTFKGLSGKTSLKPIKTVLYEQF